MKRLWVIAPVGVLLVAWLGIRCLNAHWAPEMDELPDLSQWPPDAQTVAHELASEKDMAKKRALFASLLTSRFRDRPDAIAIRVSWTNPNTIKLCCPARMEPWNMSRIALMVWHEARNDLGENCSITIFHTYISPGLIKVGELQPMPQNPNRAKVKYNFHVTANQLW